MEISGKTKLTCLLGSPVEHSISPKMHNAAFELLGLDYKYLAFDTKGKDLKTVVEGLRALNVAGFNITMPDKVAMLDLVDELTDAARIAGACNTVINQNGKLIGHTTDGVGFMRSALDAGYNLTGKNMTILGMGGAATAIITQAALDGMKEIYICRRPDPIRFAEAVSFAESVSKQTDCKVTVHDMTDDKELKSCIDKSDILTNATNVGMAPDIDKSPIKDTSFFHEGLVVSDIIYNPMETKLLAMAKTAGCKTFNGLYMLLYQGAASFQCWTGQEMPTEEIKKIMY